MKKVICVLLVVICLLAGCVSTETLDGTVRFHHSEMGVFALVCDGEEGTYAVRIGPDTEIIWQIDEECTFREGLAVSVVPGEPAENLSKELNWQVCQNDDVWFYADTVYITGIEYNPPTHDMFYKPVIYLYPETETDVNVRLNFDGKLTCTYPAYNGGWSVTASPDGTLYDRNGQSYYCLYWEGEGETDFDFSQGFCVAGKDSAAFLEDALAKLGLTRREANEFIIYWLPLLEANPYNLISFQTDAYTECAELEITPEPDTLIRVYMAWKSLESAVEIQPQTFTAPRREGFTVIEWGGTEVK